MTKLYTIAFLLCASPLMAQNWAADHEEGNLTDWSNTVGSVSSGGAFNSGGQTSVVPSFGTASSPLGQRILKTRITGAYDHTVACRLLRWRDTAGHVFPKTAYYTTWMYIPNTYRTYSWWNIYQFKSQTPDNSTSNPMLTGNLSTDGSTGYRFYFYDHNRNQSYTSSVRIPSRKWVKIETKFTYGVTDGAIQLRIDGQLGISKTGLQTRKTANDRFLVWGVGNYTNKISGPEGNGVATVYFDNCSVHP